MGIFDRAEATQETIMTAAMGQINEIAAVVEAEQDASAGTELPL